MNILIIDDDVEMIKKLKKDLFIFFSEYVDRTHIYSYSSNYFSIDRTIDYDFCFVDIDLIDESGIEVVKYIKEEQLKVKIVFISGYLNLIHDSLIVQPFYFIRKRYYKNDLANFFVIYTNMKKSKELISLNYKYNRVIINVEDIIYVASFGHQLTVKTKKRLYEDNRKLMDIQEYLSNQGTFARVHKSYIINLEYLVSYKKNMLILEDGTEIVLGRVYKKDFDKRFQEYLLRW